MNDDSFEETWKKFRNGQASYREVIIASNEKNLRSEPDLNGGVVWILRADGDWGAEALRIIADELDQRTKNAPTQD